MNKAEIWIRVKLSYLIYGTLFYTVSLISKISIITKKILQGRKKNIKQSAEEIKRQAEKIKKDMEKLNGSADRISKFTKSEAMNWLMGGGKE